MQCPVCKTQRCEAVDLTENLKAAACPGCEGHWVSHANYAAWLEQHGETLPEKPFSEITFDVEDVREAKICPDCGKILLKYKVGHGLDFFVDHCPGCGGIWLDRNEWAALQERNLHDELFKVFSTTWQTRVRGEQMHSRLETAYENRFGADTYGRLKEIREWIQDHPQKRAILAFVSDEDPYAV